MMNGECGKTNSEKLSYELPKLRVIGLVTDEILGVGCKTASDVVPTSLCGTSACGTQVGS